MRQLSSGAESIIYINEKNNVVKDRKEKSYRIKEIDTPLRATRTKKELKIMQSLQKLKIAVPKIISNTDTKIEMEFVDGIQLKKLLDKDPKLSLLIGQNLSIMHDNDIVHGDLTTSNMIVKKISDKDDDKPLLYFIDFGLSFNSKRVEDKAVDVHLFKQALESKHFRVYDEAYKTFLKGYAPKNKKEILQRLHTVEQRGRYKEKV